MILMTADNIQDKFCFKRYTAQTRDTVESDEQSIDNNVEKGASRKHPNLSEYIRITCLLFSPAILLSFSTSI